jgi:hypothetical protein
MNEDMVGWASTEGGLVVLRLADVEKWDDQTLYRNLRHELAHVGLSRYLLGAKVPRWLAEGYSEFAAGGLTCESEVRLIFFLRSQQQERDSARLRLRLDEIGNTRLGYDLFASFFAFLEASPMSSVTSGMMFANMQRWGVDEGLRRTFGVSIEVLEQRWRSPLVKKYRQSLDVVTERCVAADVR